MKSFATLAVALLALGACAASAAPPHAFDKSYVRGVDCAVRVIKDRDGVTFSPVVSTARPLRGEYDFVVLKGGRAGSATSEQGGPLALRAGDREALGSISLGGSPGRYVARLTVRDARGTVCEAVTPKGRV